MVRGSSWGVVIGNIPRYIRFQARALGLGSERSVADSTVEPSIPGASWPASGALSVIVQEHPRWALYGRAPQRRAMSQMDLLRWCRRDHRTECFRVE